MSIPGNLNELDVRHEEAARSSRRRGNASFTAEEVAKGAICCLAAIAGPTRQERDRALRHALKLNGTKVRGTTNL
jgi:hypothetical protein